MSVKETALIHKLMLDTWANLLFEALERKDTDQILQILRLEENLSEEI